MFIWCEWGIRYLSTLPLFVTNAVLYYINNFTSKTYSLRHFSFFVSILSIQTAGIENTAQAGDKEKLLLYFIITLLLLILLNLSCFIYSH